MAWLQKFSFSYHVAFRFGGTLIKRSLRTLSEKEARLV
jgi:hypothetical protein